MAIEVKQLGLRTIAVCDIVQNLHLSYSEFVTVCVCVCVHGCFSLPPMEWVLWLFFLQYPLLSVMHTIMAMMRVRRMMTPSKVPTTPTNIVPDTENSPIPEDLLPKEMNINHMA